MGASALNPAQAVGEGDVRSGDVTAGREPLLGSGVLPLTRYFRATLRVPRKSGFPSVKVEGEPEGEISVRAVMPCVVGYQLGIWISVSGE